MERAADPFHMRLMMTEQLPEADCPALAGPPGKLEHLGHHQEHHQAAVGVDRRQASGPRGILNSIVFCIQFSILRSVLRLGCCGRNWAGEIMESLTVRISKSTHAALRAIADESNESMTEILDKAIKLYKRQRFLEGLNMDFAALRKSKAAWAEELAERNSWDVTLPDGLED